MNVAGLHAIPAELIGPQDTVVTVGSEATFTCTSTTESSEPPCFISKYKATDANEYRYLHYHDESDVNFLEARCSITSSNNNRTSSLTVKNVQPADAGLYKCSLCWTQESSDAALSVVGKKMCSCLPSVNFEHHLQLYLHSMSMSMSLL